MPIYEYHCASCDADFEQLVKIDAPTPACPACGEVESVAKRVSASSFVLKGGGWYKDLYGLKSGGSKETAPSSGAGPTSSGD